MAVARWAPWASVFIGGCLTGAALLSLSTSENAAPPRVTEPAPQTSEPSAPDEHLPAPDVDDSSARHATALPPLPPASVDELDTEAAGASAAEVLANLERAYQEQLSASTASTSELTLPESPTSPTPLALLLPADAGDSEPSEPPGASETPIDDEAPLEVAEVQRAKEVQEEVDLADTQEEVGLADTGHDQIEHVSVFNYQPVYVLNGAIPTSAPPPAASPPRIGLDPWASWPHHSWVSTGTSTSVSGGVWFRGAQGSMWGASFRP